MLSPMPRGYHEFYAVYGWVRSIRISLLEWLLNIKWQEIIRYLASAAGRTLASARLTAAAMAARAAVAWSRSLFIFRS